MAVEKVIEDIAQSAGYDQGHGHAPGGVFLGQEEISYQTNYQRDAQNQQRNLKIGENAPSGAAVSLMDEGKFDPHEIFKNANPSIGISGWCHMAQGEEQLSEKFCRQIDHEQEQSHAGG